MKLTHRFLAGRQLPDKAVSILDTACARLALGQNATPPAIEDLTRQIDALEVQTRILNREEIVGADHQEKLAEIAAQKQKAEEKLKTLQDRWEKERDLVGKIRDLRNKLEGAAESKAAAATARPERLRASPVEQNGHAAAAEAAAATTEETKAQLQALEAELSALQGETGLIRVCVDAQIVGEVLSAWTGIPAGKMLKDEITTVLALQDHLGKRVIGQAARDGDHLRSACRPRAPRSMIPTSRWACSCWWGPAAWARRRPRWRCPTCSTAASTT